MGSNGPTVLHIGYLPATVEEVFFPHAEVVGDVGPSLALLADRLEGKLANAGALLPLIERPFYTCIKFGRFYFAYHTAR